MKIGPGVRVTGIPVGYACFQTPGGDLGAVLSEISERYCFTLVETPRCPVSMFAVLNVVDADAGSSPNAHSTIFVNPLGSFGFTPLEVAIPMTAVAVKLPFTVEVAVTE
jgi:hypothetical protein